MNAQVKTAQHTPGPWHAVPCTLRDGFTIAQTQTPSRCANVANIAQIGSNVADARLIAAAPDLLEALERMCAPGDEADQAAALRHGREVLRKLAKAGV